MYFTYLQHFTFSLGILLILDLVQTLKVKRQVTLHVRPCSVETIHTTVERVLNAPCRRYVLQFRQKLCAVVEAIEGWLRSCMYVSRGYCVFHRYHFKKQRRPVLQPCG